MIMNNFPSQYKPIEVEQKWQKLWQEQDLYKWDENISREDSFIIDTPPPTVSGSLHMGHVFSYSQADFVARYQRMKGKNVFYPMGFDDNGLPTERLVEKAKNIRAVHMDRTEFQKICYDTIEEAEKEFYNLFNSIALSIDWSQKYQTISTSSRKISQLSFLDMHSKNEVYRKLQPSLWDTVDNTALAQADVVDSEILGKMYNIRFFTQDLEPLIIATTRPELIPACVAVFFNDRDDRYQNLKGKNAISPIFGASVPIIPDQSVDIAKGTGLVMCCTFGDITDVDWWRRYNLPIRIVLDQSGNLSLRDKLTDSNFNFQNSVLLHEAVQQLEGVKVQDAREKIVEILHATNCIETEQEVIKNVKCAERSGSALEILVTPQWFIKILDKKQQLLEKSAQCNWFPKYMKVRLDNWIEGLNWDWCISRQRFFGVPIPVWYSKRFGEEGKIILPRPEDLPVDPLIDIPFGYSKNEVVGEVDVMDTWATSAVSPQTNSHAINDNFAVDINRHRKLFPADLRPQAHEIIRTWTFYTIAKALIHENIIPWKNLMLSGWCLAADKTKMSKSKGNVITPIELIQEKGSDVVRYWASTSKLGADITYSEEAFKIGKKLVNKLWNASKFVALNIQDIDCSKLDLSQVSRELDLWILSKFHQAVKKSTEEFEVFEYFNARIAIEDFFWKDFCDNYLEIVKVRIYNTDKLDYAGQKSAKTTIAFILEMLLRLFAPFIPHITEELYSIVFAKRDSIHAKGNWPNYKLMAFNEHSQKIGDDIVEILDVVRKIKAERKLSLKAPVQKIVIKIVNEDGAVILPEITQDLKNVTNTKEIEFIKDQDYALEQITNSGRYHLKLYFQ